MGLAAIAAAKATIEARAVERLQREKVVIQNNSQHVPSKRRAPAKKKTRGPSPAPPTGGVKDRDQVN